MSEWAGRGWGAGRGKVKAVMGEYRSQMTLMDHEKMLAFALREQQLQEILSRGGRC